MHAAAIEFPPRDRASKILAQQQQLYSGDFYRRRRWRWTFRDDCRYRWHRLRECLQQVGFPLYQQRVFEVGFGSGDLLAMFPTSCKLMGVELSGDAVVAIRADPRLRYHRDTWFTVVDETGGIPLPPEPADIVLSSHVLEHVPDDREHLQQLLAARAPGGLLVLFLPLEEPGFDPKHVRTYTADSVRELLEGLGMEVLHVEENYRICLGPLRWADHPARHGWPLLKSIEGLRNLLLTAIPDASVLALEQLLTIWSVPATQVMAVAR